MREKLQTLPLTVLREFAKDKHIKNITVMRKADLIEAIIKADEEEKAAKDEQEKTVKAEPEQPIKNVQPVKNEHEHANINHNDGYVPRNRQNVNNVMFRTDLKNRRWQMVFSKLCRRDMDL